MMTASSRASSISSTRWCGPISSSATPTGAGDRPWLSNSRATEIEALPLPRPLFEIFVYSPRVEGVHLRFGRVARGGIRWSDRPQDFRTEVLGLVKAQQVKNAVIVPVGAKGGFFPKRLPPAADRDAWLAEGTESYKHLHLDACSTSPTISTATASCIRRRRSCATTATIPISWSRPTRARPPSRTPPTRFPIERDYWLGDAFASGGQPGLRPQEDGHHGARRLGSGEAPFPRDRHRHPDHPVHGVRRRRHVGRRVRQRHAAVARRSSSSPPSIIATSSSIPLPMPSARSASANACSICRARAGRITTAR